MFILSRSTKYVSNSTAITEQVHVARVLLLSLTVERIYIILIINVF